MFPVRLKIFETPVSLMFWNLVRELFWSNLVLESQGFKTPWLEPFWFSPWTSYSGATRPLWSDTVSLTHTFRFKVCNAGPHVCPTHALPHSELPPHISCFETWQCWPTRLPHTSLPHSELPPHISCPTHHPPHLCPTRAWWHLLFIFNLLRCRLYFIYCFAYLDNASWGHSDSSSTKKSILRRWESCVMGT